MRPLRFLLLLLSATLAVSLDELVDPTAALRVSSASAMLSDATWRFATLADGTPYWWRPSQLIGVSEPEISFERPDEAWQKGLLDDGAPYLWRKVEGELELQMWSPRKLDDGQRYWWRLAGDGSTPEVTLRDPYAHAQPDALLGASKSAGCEA
uniref:Uncharacterized protein n=1 Tax=Coccolithus braarudii TaxID=221442 RepID=A0A7S0L3W0_9EUKA|mmetsp:Transcript_18380/g.39554  ORF Transcript_18380/g.39554 Transcript_18380/m.39554 type:complete len:153 (+) Transcript_18380:78-536(+)|eukprot:CAMPEP_0183350490 /NCGR_PEP_ID=MMETSP0164_2-20130417/19254_1 /TAXON_ID=221442 /ORGANISM="Coccolithus pelagicus ssp braarudi, Strain PLY182g" /LENGTH=152 /DNA_ID=CAMNT_0025522417 /DNA_START=70 /DNA_END=528 /DNA_ORIENTATION=+